MMSKKHLFLAMSGLASLMLLGSCQDEDYGYMTEEVRASVYDRNFIAHYGDIDPNQSWDFSTAGIVSSIAAAREAAEQAGMTRGTQDFTTTGGTWCTGDEHPWSEATASVSVSTSVVSGGTATITATKSSAATPFVESHDLLQWVKKRLQEGDRRFLYGDGMTNKEEFNQRFNMIATEKSFRLMPVFQGIDNTVWDFHALIEWEDPNGATEADKYKSADIVLWRKSEGMTMQGERPNLMGESIQDYVFANSTETYNGYRPVGDLGSQTNQVLAVKDGEVQIHESWDDNQKKNVPDREANQVIDPNGDVRFETTRLAADINSQWVTVTGYPEKISTITFYIHILQDNDEVTDGAGSKFYSDGREAGANAITSNMIVLPVQVDIKEYAGREIVLMGVETSKSGKKTYDSADALKSAIYTDNTAGNSIKSNGNAEKEKHDYSDDDMNDIVFLLVGDEVKLPELNNLNVISKRYFFEDLGSVVDWDFNDVVLDMNQELYLKTDVNPHTRYLKQTALLKHRCGTTPFSLWLSEGEGSSIQYKRIPFGTNNDKLRYDADKLIGVNEGEAMEYFEEVTLFDVPVDQAKSQNLFWDADNNNVAIKVYASLSEGYKNWNNPNATKPGSGEETINDGTWAEFHARYTGEDGKKNIPRVFVADQSVWWTPESQNFPNIWKKPAELSAKDKAELEALMTKPQGAVPNDYSNSLHGIGSDRSFRYPFLEGNEFILWNTPTRFDRWEPLWLSEGFVEGLEQGYTTLNVEFGDCNTNFKVLYREDYTATDANYTINNNEWQGATDGSTYKNNIFSFQIPATGNGSIEYYLKAKNEKGLSPSIGIQDQDAWGSGSLPNGHEGDNWHIYINKVWLTTGTPDSGEPQQPVDKDFNITLGQDINRVLTDMSYNSMVSADQLKNVKVGDKIVINMKDVAGDAQIQILEMGSWSALVSSTSVSGKTTYELNVTNDNIENIKKGIDIQGKGFTITKVELVEGEPVDDTITGTTILEGSVTLYNNGSVTIGNWDKNLKIEASAFNNNSVKTGDVIIVHTSGLHTNSQGGLRDNSWNAIADGKEYFDITGDYELEVTDDILSKITNNGLIITGRYYTIEKVTLRPAAVLPTFTLTATLATGCENMGTIEINPQKSAYHTDDVVTVNAKAKPGYKFVSWSDSGAQSHTITIGEENVTVTATFEKDPDYVAPENLVWTPNEDFQINKNWNALASNEGLNNEVKEYLKDYSGSIKIYFTASEITEQGDNVFHLMTSSWETIIEGINISSKEAETTLTAKQTDKLKDGIYFQSGIGFKLSEVEIEKLD